MHKTLLIKNKKIMVKAIFFESKEGRLHRCIYAGLDYNHRPQLVMIDQGDEMMTLQDYMKRQGMEDEDMRLLCLEGETLESTTMAQLLGAVLMGYSADHAKVLSEAIKNLRNKGIGWKQDKLQMEVHVREYYEEVNHQNEYRFYIFCDCYDFVFEMDNFFTMKKLMAAVRCYFEALEKEAGIGLRKELQLADPKLLKKLGEEDMKMFETIN
jgi:hypothetical protein